MAGDKRLSACDSHYFMCSLHSSFPGTSSFDCRKGKTWKASALLGHRTCGLLCWPWQAPPCPRVKICLIVAGSYIASAFVLVETLSLFLSKQHLGFLQPCLAKTVSRFIFIILKFNYMYGGHYVHTSAGACGVWNYRQLWTALCRGRELQFLHEQSVLLAIEVTLSNMQEFAV